MSYPIRVALSASLLFSGCTLVSKTVEKPSKKSIKRLAKESIETAVVETPTKISIEESVEDSIEKPIEVTMEEVIEVPEEVIEVPIKQQEKLEVQNLTVNKKSSSNSNIIKDEFNDDELTITQDANNLEGKYILERGQVSFSGVRKDIIDSKLVIEKLGVNDLGYYYTVKVKGYPANEYFGIFSKKDGKYVQKIISDNGEVSYYDNIELIHEDQRLKLTIKTTKEKRIIIWKKADFIDNDEKLKGAKEIYNQVCKANYCEET